ncbi:hypothetical protein OIU76_023903 [Salix suchowensis]|nr:hypothetical protein OIU76_023903 [Salix suchowensis]
MSNEKPQGSRANSMVGKHLFLGQKKSRSRMPTPGSLLNPSGKAPAVGSGLSFRRRQWKTRSNGQDRNELQGVLEQGLWLFGGKHLILQQWSPRFQFDTSKISSLPVWIRLRRLPIPLWSIKGLSMVASMVGTPLSCDEATHKCTRLEYAHICVEIDASLPYVHQFQILTPLSPTPITIHVDYEWKPARCNTCKVFGHACVEKEGIITEKENQGSKEGNDMSVPVIQHEEGADKRMSEHTTKGRNDMQFNPNHNHPLNQTNQIAGSSHVLKPHRPMQSTNPKVKTVAHPAEAHKNSHPAHLNNNPDPEIAEPTDWTDTTASSAKEKDTALIRAKGKGPLHAENNSNTILGIGTSNEDTGESASSVSAGPTEDNAEDPSSPAPKTARKKKGGKSRKVGNHQ